MVSGPLNISTARSSTPPISLSNASVTTIKTALTTPSTPLVDIRSVPIITQSAPSTPTIANSRIIHNHHNSEPFEIDDAYECEIVNTLVSLLLRHGPLTLGKIGSMLHNHLNNHHLPAALKRQYGGLQKFVRKHRNQFLIGDDHPYNPHLHLITAKNFVQPQQSIVPSSSTPSNTTTVPLTPAPTPVSAPLTTAPPTPFVAPLTPVPAVRKTTSPLTPSVNNQQLFMLPQLSVPLIDPVFYNNYLQYSMQFLDYPFVPTVNYFMDGSNNVFPLH